MSHTGQKDWLWPMLISLGLVLVAYLCWQAGQDILGIVRLSFAVFTGHISRRAVMWVFFLLGNGILLVFLTLAVWKRGPLAQGSPVLINLDRLRDRMGWTHWLLAAVLVTLPSILILILPQEEVFGKGALRLWVLLAAAAGFAVVVTRSRQTLVGWLPFLAGLLAIAVVFSAAHALTLVTDYPFALGWSEGNRLYDYSLTFGRNLYSSQYPIVLPAYSPGRYALWGILFLVPGLPIAIHRLWDGILWNITPLIFGWLLFPGMNWKWRAGLALWVALFLAQGPIYPMLLIAAILLVLAFRSERAWKWTGIAAGGLYAGLSRWTWLASIGVWGAILEQLFRPQREKPLFVRYFPAVLVFITGLLPGFLANLPRWLAPKASTLSLSQPLLWYRLFPNATYPLGILLNLMLAVIPLVVFLVWLALTRRWTLDGSQVLMVFAACGVFLAAGLVASIKIGGGSNLHNLDMFFVTLIFLLVAAVRESTSSGTLAFHHWPVWVRVWVSMAVLIPVCIIFFQYSPQTFPSQELAGKYVVDVQHQVDAAREKGEILFIDQRQLLTYGMIHHVDLVSDYEKKYMMDQAMAGNATYFKRFYQDLSSHRFALIVTEPLFLVERGEGYSFGEENDAFVKWVSQPVLCHYQILSTLSEVRIQYLVPRQEPSQDLNCQP
jgi:hypothetical protein